MIGITVDWQAIKSKFPGSEVRTYDTRDGDDEFESINVRAFLWTLFFFKMATVTAIYLAARGTSDVGLLLVVTTWPWLIIPAIVVLGWSIVRLRMRRVRAKRDALQRAEWMLDEHETMEVVRVVENRDR